MARASQMEGEEKGMPRELHEEGPRGRSVQQERWTDKKGDDAERKILNNFHLLCFTCFSTMS